MCSARSGDQLLCAGVWVLTVFAQTFVPRGAPFVRRRVGFERFYVFAVLLLCAGASVLRGFTFSLYYFLCAGALGFSRFYHVFVMQLLCAGA